MNRCRLAVRLKVRELPTCPVCGAVLHGKVCERCDAEPLPKPNEKIMERDSCDLEKS